MTRSRIIGLGAYAPDRVVRNTDLEKLMETSDAWIVERTGIRERRFVEPGTGSSDLGYEAAVRAIADAGVVPADIDFIIFATTSPDYLFPGNGSLLQHRLGVGPIGSLNVGNACSGFVYSLAVADAFIRMGLHRHILVVGAEVQSTGLDFSTAGRDMAVLFGDGAGAAVVAACDASQGFRGWALHSEGVYARDLWMEAPTCRVAGRLTPEMLAAGAMFPRMNGRQVFKHATVRFPEVIHEVLAGSGHTLDEVRLIVPHQANQRIGDTVAERLGVPAVKVFQNIEHYGNTTAASIPLALVEAREAGRFAEGDLVVLAAFGAGFAWGACALRW